MLLFLRVNACRKPLVLRLHPAGAIILIVTKGCELPHYQLGDAVYHISTRVAEGFTLNSNSKQIVLDAIRFFHKVKYMLIACVVMPDHIHLLIRPLKDVKGEFFMLDSIMHSIKSFTAHEINKSLKRSGSVWQRNYRDRWIRNADDFDEVWKYIIDNPVEAGLVRKWEDYPYTWYEGMI